MPELFRKISSDLAGFDLTGATEVVELRLDGFCAVSREYPVCR